TMAVKTPKTRATRASEDPRVTKLMTAIKADSKLAPSVETFEANAKAAGGRKFGSNGLKVNGKLFALFMRGTLVVKLPKDRVVKAIGHNSAMKDVKPARRTARCSMLAGADRMRERRAPPTSTAGSSPLS
ncbi:MAG: hypothetical protein M3O46_20185, partial [Myxococcota bacterium]|nr:hypothetical protein [Myxococcota bacterium]